MLEAESLSYRLKNRFLIHSIDYTFYPGRFYAVLGSNGSGKSTLLKSLAGIWQPTHGTVRWCGTPLLQQSRQAISRLITFMAPLGSVSFHFTVTEIVAMGRYSHGKKISSEIIEKVLRQMHVWQLRDCYIDQVSSGERQRVYLARALATEATVLLLDEPTAQLDLFHQVQVWQALRQLVDQGKTVIMATHDIRPLYIYCDETLVLKEGVCVASGKTDTVLTPTLFQEVFNVNFAFDSICYEP